MIRPAFTFTRPLAVGLGLLGLVAVTPSAAQADWWAPWTWWGDNDPAAARDPALPALDSGISDGAPTSDVDGGTDDDDHDRARGALERGEVLPLAEVLRLAGPTLGGEVIEVELEREDGRLVYEFTIVTPQGRLLEAVVDAASARVLEIEDD